MKSAVEDCDCEVGEFDGRVRGWNVSFVYTVYNIVLLNISAL